MSDDTLIIYTNNAISLNGVSTGFYVMQGKFSTIVYKSSNKIGLNDYVEYALPVKRYALSCNNPDSGRPGRSDFDRDFINLYKIV